MLLPFAAASYKMKGRCCHRDNLLSLWAGDNGRPSGTSTKSSPVVRVHTDHRHTVHHTFQPLIHTKDSNEIFWEMSFG